MASSAIIAVVAASSAANSARARRNLIERCSEDYRPEECAGTCEVIEAVATEPTDAWYLSRRTYMVTGNRCGAATSWEKWQETEFNGYGILAAVLLVVALTTLIMTTRRNHYSVTP